MLNFAVANLQSHLWLAIQQQSTNFCTLLRRYVYPLANVVQKHDILLFYALKKNNFNAHLARV